MNFTDLHLHEDLMKGIEKAEYTICTPVQEQVLTGAFEGSDLYVQSQTGTGKTAAYLITIIQQILTNPKMSGKKALVMVPTRELAVQVEEEARILVSGTKLKTGSFYGGVGYERQTALLKSGVDILIGTPGRVIDLQESKIMNLNSVGFLVVDEADRMFDMGFYPDLRTLIKVLPETSQRQTMLFSATLNTYVKNLAWEYTSNAQEITIETENITVDEIDQVLLHVSSSDKVRLLLGILKNEKPESVIIFCNTKRSCEVIAKRLQLNGIECDFIIGDLPQSKRLQVLNSFKRGSLFCLAATDVAARGIDVDDLAMVINFDLPNEAENYVHRIGRTARAGKTGKSYTFCSEQDVYSLPAIERYIEGTIPSSVASEDMFADDKSAGVYIRTETYGTRSETHRSGDSGKLGSKTRPASGKEKPAAERSGKLKPASRRNAASPEKPLSATQAGASSPRTAKAAKSEIQSRPQSNSADMANLSFEDRMKLYRKKYGGKNETQSKAQNALPKNAAQHKATPHKNRRSKDKDHQVAAQNIQPVKNSKAVQMPLTADKLQKKPAAPQKMGLLSRIKALFGKK